MNKTKVIAAALFLIVFWMSFATASEQCRCCDYPTGVEALDGSDSVFIGVVTDVELQWNVFNWAKTQVQNMFRFDGGHYIAPRSKVTATLSVLEVFKGSDRSTRVIDSYPTGGWCGLDFEVGKTYLVYGSDSGLRLWAGRCSASKEIDGDEIEAIKQAFSSKGAAI